MDISVINISILMPRIAELSNILSALLSYLSYKPGSKAYNTSILENIEKSNFDFLRVKYQMYQVPLRTSNRKGSTCLGMHMGHQDQDGEKVGQMSLFFF